MVRRKLLVLAAYPRRAAATRFRACAYFPALERAGIEVDFRPFMDDEYMASFYAHGRVLAKSIGMLRFSLERLRLLLSHGHYDGIFVQREAMLLGPALVEWVFASVRNVPMVFDLDDAIWLEQEGGRHPLVSKLVRMPSKTYSIMRLAQTVVAGTQYLADCSHALGAPRTTVLPTVVSCETWQPLPGRLDGALASSGLPVLGWVGTHSTAVHLDLVIPALAALAAEGRKFRVRIVGASKQITIPGVEVECLDWSAEREIDDFRRIDIGLAPLIEDEWSRGKCGFKQVQYMTVGVPHVTSPVGGAREFVKHEVNGLVADTTEQWTAALRRLLDDRALRGELARAGRRLVEESMSTEAQSPRFVETIEKALVGA